MNRNVWGVTSAIVGGILGVFELIYGYYLISVFGFASSFIEFFLFDITGLLSTLSWMGILLGVIYLGVGVGRFVVIYGLVTKLNWARITAAVLHFLVVFAGLPLLLLMIQSGLAGLVVLPILLTAANVALGIMLLRPDTAADYQSSGIRPMAPPTMVARQTFIAAAPLPQSSPPPVQPVAPTAAASYAQPGQVRVARTEVAGPKTPQVTAWLVERNGPRPGKEHRLDQQITIGRDASRCEIVIDDSKVSAEHARIRLEQGQFVIFDLASTNHTYVNDTEVQRHVLRDGDQIRLGPNVKLTFMQVNRG